MSRRPPTARSTDRTFRCLSDATRRRCLAILRRRDGAVAETTLATRLAAESGAGTAADVGREERRRVRVELVHAHLPKLSEADLVTWDRDAGTVDLLDDSVANDLRFREPPAADPAEWDEVLGALAESRRRIALAVLVDADEPLDRRELVERVLARESESAPTAPSEREIEEAELAFGHKHLPALQSAGLVTVGDDGVEAGGGPVFEAALVASQIEPAAPRVAGQTAD